MQALVVAGRLTSLPDAIGQLTQLQKLSLGHNAIPSLPGTVSCLIKLEHLDLSHNSLQALPQVSRLRDHVTLAASCKRHKCMKLLQLGQRGTVGIMLQLGLHSILMPEQ